MLKNFVGFYPFLVLYTDQINPFSPGLRVYNDLI